MPTPRKANAVAVVTFGGLVLLLTAQGCETRETVFIGRVPQDAASPASDPPLDASAGSQRECGLGTPPCPEGEFCLFSGLLCAANEAGRCVTRPDCNTQCEVPTICGCDGRLHCSECAARASGVDVAEAAFCAGPEIRIRCGSWLGPQCSDEQFCDFMEAGRCGADTVGVCLQRPMAEVCPAECNPVCGCDGINYCNECIAHVVGTDRGPPENCETAL